MLHEKLAGIGVLGLIGSILLSAYLIENGIELPNSMNKESLLSKIEVTEFEDVRLDKIFDLENGEYIVAGTETKELEERTEYNGFISKLDSKYNEVWSSKIEFKIDNFILQDVVKSNDGGYIAVGYSIMDSDLKHEMSATGTEDGMIVKLDDAGEIVWEKVLYGNSTDMITALHKVEGDVYVAVGYSKSTDLQITDMEDGILVLFNEKGEILTQSSIGGDKSDFFYDVEVIGDNIILGGYSLSSNLGVQNKGSSDALIVSVPITNSEEVNLYSLGGEKQDRFYSLTETSDGGFIAVGSTMSPNLSKSKKDFFHPLIVKYDKEFNVEWINEYNKYKDAHYFMKSAIETEEGYDVVGALSIPTEGRTENYDSILIKFNKEGKLTSIDTVGGIEYDAFTSMSENGLIVGYTRGEGKTNSLIYEIKKTQP